MERAEIFEKVTEIVRKVVRCGDKPITPSTDLDQRTSCRLDGHDGNRGPYRERRFTSRSTVLAEVNLRRVEELIALVERNQQPTGNTAPS